jgi:hypothetical protein
LNDLETFKKNLSNYEGDYPCTLGEDHGNLKIDKSTKSGDIDYFLGKAFNQFGRQLLMKKAIKYNL